MKHKKGQAMGTLMALVGPLIAIALVLAIGFLIMTGMKEQVENLDSSNWCGTNYFYNSTGLICCNATGCPTSYLWNSSASLCCNSTGTTPFDCATGNTTATIQVCNTTQTVNPAFNYAWNATGTTQNAIDDIPGWLPIIVVAIIGAVILGLVTLFRTR